MPRYFVELPGKRVHVPWDLRAGPVPEQPATRYFGAAFRHMEGMLADPEIDVYLTMNPDRLPAYGDHVVAVVLADEVGRIPRYVDRVRAVFKNYGVRPELGGGPLRDPSLTGFLELAQYAVRWLRWLPGGAAHARVLASGRLRGRPARPPVDIIPLGTFNQLDVPSVPIEERPTDLFFAGSVEHEASVRHRLGSPKTLARREMVSAVEELGRRRPNLRVDLRLTAGFEASKAESPAEYSQALMNARVCLAPRGTSVESFRVFEGLRCGCVVVAERLPDHWFYAGSPILQVDRWRDLEEAIRPVLDDPAELRRRHALTLAWWHDRCSEPAIGRFLAERLNALVDGRGASAAPAGVDAPVGLSGRDAR
jgi:hypothetical protein